MLVGHFLMVGVALLGTSRLDLLAHHDVDSQVLLNVALQFKQPRMVNEELHVPPVLLRAPRVAHKLGPTTPRTLPLTQFLQGPRRNVIRLLSLHLTLFNLDSLL